MYIQPSVQHSAAGCAVISSNRHSAPASCTERAHLICRCAICQMDYEQGDSVSLWPCKHFYHSDCAMQWLQINKVGSLSKPLLLWLLHACLPTASLPLQVCPICNAEIIPEASKSEL